MTTFESQGQAPGYRGKRLVVDYGLPTAMTISYGTYKKPNGDLAFTFRHDLGFSYILNRILDVGAHVGFFKGGLGTHRFFNGVTNDYESRHFGIKVKSIGLHFTKYSDKKGSIAPLGFYYRGEWILLFGKAMEKLGDGSYEKYGDGVFDTGLLITSGRKFVMYDWMTLDVGLQFGLAFRGITKWGGGDLGISNLKKIDNNVLSRMAPLYLVSFRLAIGIIPV
jgi:hypothetical protein